MRVLHYSDHSKETVDIQRSLDIATQVIVDFPYATQLLVSDRPQPRGSKLPDKLDFIKLPCTDRFSRDQFHEPSVDVHPGVNESYREGLILRVIEHFYPDVVLVDGSDQLTEQKVLHMKTYLQAEQIETKFVFARGDVEHTASMIRNTVTGFRSHTGYSTNSEDVGMSYSECHEYSARPYGDCALTHVA